jgi:hypothetical protein
MTRTAERPCGRTDAASCGGRSPTLGLTNDHPPPPDAKGGGAALPLLPMERAPRARLALTTSASLVHAHPCWVAGDGYEHPLCYSFRSVTSAEAIFHHLPDQEQRPLP